MIQVLRSFPKGQACWRQCSNQLSYEATQTWAGQFVGLMCSRERNDEWNECLWSVVERWTEEMVLNVLAGQSQRLSHLCTWKISGVFNGIRTHDLCDAGASTELWSWSYETRSRGLESRWRHLKIFTCTNETIAEIVHWECEDHFFNSINL